MRSAKVLVSGTILSLIRSYNKSCKEKTVSMDFKTFNTPQAKSTESYTWRLMGMGPSFRERLCQRVHCLECRVGLAAGLLTAHCQQKYGVGRNDPPSPSKGVWEGGRERRES